MIFGILGGRSERTGSSLIQAAYATKMRMAAAQAQSKAGQSMSPAPKSQSDKNRAALADALAPKR
jgi:hypothetical protein